VYGVVQRWIMTVKDHATGLIYLCSLPRKRAAYVTFELEKIFGLIGYPHIFHTDNGKEFVAKTVVQMLLKNNPHCFVVTGRPRTPRDQGSVESANKLVKRVMASILAERRMIPDLDDNWTKILGQTMSMINSNEGRRKNSIAPYTVVFGQSYYPTIKCSIDLMRQCVNISDRLRISSDERLQKYVSDQGIVDVAYDSDDEFIDEESLDGDMNDTPVEYEFSEEYLNSSNELQRPYDGFIDKDVVDDDDQDPIETISAAAPGTNVEETADEQKEAETATMFSGTEVGKTVGEESPGEEREADITRSLLDDYDYERIRLDVSDYEDTPATSSAMVAPTVLFDASHNTSNEVSCRKQPPPGPDPTMTGSFWPGDQSTSPTIAQPTSYRSTIPFEGTVRSAWQDEHIARSAEPMNTADGRSYRFICARLTCDQCCFPMRNRMLVMGDDDYLNACRSTNRWYDGDFVSSFATVASHYAHKTLSQRLGQTDYPPLPQLLIVTFPRQELQPNVIKALKPETQRVVGVIHDTDHYAVMELSVQENKITMFDGLRRPLIRWMDHVISALKRSMLIGLRDTWNPVPDEPTAHYHGSVRTRVINGYTIVVRGAGEENDVIWKLVRGDFIKQVDGHNCGPIACLKILEQFGLTTTSEVRLAYDLNSIRGLVVNEWTRMTRECDDDLRVVVRRPWRPLLEPVASLEDSATAQSSVPNTQSAIAAAAAATTNADDADLDICFCASDSPTMVLLQLECCRHTIHKQCLLGYLEITSKCAYCRNPMDITIVTDLPEVDRELKTPATKKMTRQSDLYAAGAIDDSSPTPMRGSDQVRREAQKKRRLFQEQQATKMQKLNQKDLLDQGAGVGAVVVVSVDPRAVTHPMGLIGVIYQYKTTGGARIATSAGILSNGTGKKNPWWIPSDKYLVKAGPNEDWNLPPNLASIRQSILSGEYDKDKPPLVSIQQAHQKLIQAVSPVGKGKCGCKGGNCKKGKCGCVKKKLKCSSQCPCNGNCLGNPNNGN